MYKTLQKDIQPRGFEIRGDKMKNQRIINGDCREVLKNIDMTNSIIVTDPPFNIGYHYGQYGDNIPENEYLDMLKNICYGRPCAIIHYPETIYKLALKINTAPERVATWVYNSNIPKQHRDIAFFNVTPDFTKIKQPYKNPNDKRIKKLIAAGHKGANLYDWWHINQVKNVSKEKTAHPCQMPLEVMKNIIGILPENKVIIDPFCGSGTTGVACKLLGRDFIGIEIDKSYVQIAIQRITATEVEK